MTKLSIEINRYQVRIVSVTDKENRSYELSFNDLQDHRCIDQLDTFFQNNNCRDFSYDNYLLSWFGNHTTLIPENLFQEGQTNRFYELCFGKPSADQKIVFDRIPDAGMVHIYDIPEWIPIYFPQLFPRISIRHEGSYLIERINMLKNNDLEIILSLHRDHFLLCISKGDKLMYYSTFDHQSTEDIIYHLMFTLQQKEMLDGAGKILIHIGFDSNPELSGNLSETLKRIKALSEMEIQTEERLTNIFELCE